jgi:CDP-diacylglycerol--glycerol-3-phosphate 3-phosphatidyltransferase
MRYIPNILSLSRIPLSIAMIFLTKSPNVFIGFYAVAGIVDVLDGMLARRFHWESKLGAKLDSVGDVTFLVCAVLAAFVALRGHLEFRPYIYAVAGVIAAIRVDNLIITKVKFRQWGTIHNLFAKYAAVPIFFVIPLGIKLGKVPNPLLLAMLCVIVLASLEETWMLFVMKVYDMNMISIYHLKKLHSA